MTAPLPPIDTRATMMLRRIFIGNGFGPDDVAVEVLETKDLTVEGRISLTPVMESAAVVVPTATRGAAIYGTRQEAERGLSDYRDQITRDAPWSAKIKDLMKGESHAGWGMPPRLWPLADVNRRFAFTITCTECKGKKSLPCNGCSGKGKLPCNSCRIQWPGQIEGSIQCPDCLGTAVNPQNPSQPCYRCQMARASMPNLSPGFIACPECSYMPYQFRGFVNCRQCAGKGFKDCRLCNAKGTITEEMNLEVKLQAEFALGKLDHIPPAIFQVLDKMNPVQMAETLMRVEPDAADAKTALAFKGVLPMARLRLKVGDTSQEVLAFGEKKLMLGDVPTLLDTSLAPALAELSAGTLIDLGQRFKLVGELTAALGQGQKPGDFFRAKYPSGISRDFAFALVDRIRAVFGQATVKQRSIAAAVGVVVATGGFLGWHVANGSAFVPGPKIPHEMWDGLVALLLAGLSWLAVDYTGRAALKKLVPGTRIRTSPARLIGVAAAALTLAACAGLHFLT